MRNLISSALYLIFLTVFLNSCEIKKSADDDTNPAKCADAIPVYRDVSYDSLWQMGVPHVDSIDGGYRVFTAKWDPNVQMCPQENVLVRVSSYVSPDLIRPITVRAYAQFSSGKYDRIAIPLFEQEGGVWTNEGAPEYWPFLPASYYSESMIGYFTIHLDYLVPKSDNFFDDLNYLYANTQYIILACDYTGWPSD